MDEHEIYRLLIALDSGIRLVYVGPKAGCPYCAQSVTAVQPQAA